MNNMNMDEEGDRCDDVVLNKAFDSNKRKTRECDDDENENDDGGYEKDDGCLEDGELDVIVADQEATQRMMKNSSIDGNNSNTDSCVRSRSQQQSIYGPNDTASFSFLDEHRHRIRLERISEIIAAITCQASGMNCDFGMFKNKPLIRKIAIVLAPGLDHKTYAVDTFGAMHCKNMKKFLGRGAATRCNNPTARGNTHARTLFYNGNWAQKNSHENRKKKEHKFKNDYAAKAYKLAKAHQPMKMKKIDKKDANYEKEEGEKTDDDEDEEKEEVEIGEDASGKKNPNINNNVSSLLQMLRDAPRKLSVKTAILTAENMADMKYPLPTLVNIESQQKNNQNGKDSSKAAASSKLSLEILKLPEGFVCTQPAGMGVANAKFPEIVAMDCEMVTTKSGLALARCSVVDDCGEIIYDKLVMPPEAITNYNTEFSGVTKEQMRNITTTLEDVQRELLELIPSECVIAGHSLENDLQILKMCHANVLDTVQMYPHKRGAPFRNALRYLTERYLKRKIQHEGTHDSVTDARATLELCYLKLIRGETFGNDMSENFEECESLFDFISKENKKHKTNDDGYEMLVFETTVNQNDQLIGVSGATDTYKCINDDDVTDKMRMSMQDAPEDMPLLCFGYMRELEDVFEKQALMEKMGNNTDTTNGQTSSNLIATRKENMRERIETTEKLDERVGKIWDALPTNALLVVITAVGDAATLRYKQEEKWSRNRKFSEVEELKRKAEGLENWTDEDELALKKRWEQTQIGLTLVGVKESKIIVASTKPEDDEVKEKEKKEDDEEGLQQ